MKDFEIENNTNKLDIKDVAKKLDIKEEELILYGKDKAKVLKEKGNLNGKLILITAINPTPYGEGKTTVTIGLVDALSKLNKKSLALLREPSMGPVFGLKGGATGGGYSQVIPSSDINLHFTGDMHAITSANNLLCAAIDNHIYNGNSLKIDQVLFNRCLDVNDRMLRNVQLDTRKEKFNITAASEIMSIFCISNDLEELKNNLGNIIIGLRKDHSFVYAKDLKIEGALTAILKDAFYPNLVQTLENNPVLIHGGPFANISFGCNSIKATKLGLTLADYVVTEAGFGADLGAEKFFNIKCRKLNKKPDCIVLVATIRALKHYGNGSLNIGIKNLTTHIENLLKNNSNVIVALNKYEDDLEQDIKFVEEVCKSKNVRFAVTTSYSDGGNGSISLANQVLQLLEKENEFHYLYDNSDSLTDKILKVATNIYRATSVVYTEEAKKKINLIEKNNLSYLPICVAKTQYSLSDDKNKLLIDQDYSITVKDINIYNGAGFIVILLGNILTMPGLNKSPNYENIDVQDGNIVNII